MIKENEISVYDKTTYPIKNSFYDITSGPSHMVADPTWFKPLSVILLEIFITQETGRQ